MKPGRPARFDHEYERNGTANLFMMFAPLEGWRHVKVIRSPRVPSTTRLTIFATVFQRNRPALDALVKAADERYRLSEARATQLRQYLIWIIAGAPFCIGCLP
jgi:hypothetical protein